jgi:hypothetical protein
MSFNITPAQSCYGWNEIQGLLQDAKIVCDNSVQNLVIFAFVVGYLVGFLVVIWYDYRKSVEKQ